MGAARFFRITLAGGLEQLPSLAAALASRGVGGYLWLDFIDPAKEDLTALVEPLGLHPLSVEDCLDEQQVPKLDDFPGSTFLLVNSFSYAGRVLATEEVDFILGRDFLVTVSGHGDGGRRLSEAFDQRVRLELDTVRKGPDFLLHTVLDYTVDSKFVALEALEDDINAAEESMLEDPAGFQLSDLLRLRRALLSVRKSLFHEREILVKICRRDCPFVSEAAIYHFRDIYDHLTKFFELAEMNRDIVTSLTEIYLSLINNRMAKVANRTNLTVRRLTLITTIFMPLSLLAGIGGMSEWSMMTGPANWPVAYAAFLAAMAAIGAANYFFLRWLEGRELRRSDWGE